MHATATPRSGLMLAMLMVVVTSAIGCLGAPTAPRDASTVNAVGYHGLTADHLAEMLAQEEAVTGETFTLVNVHVPYAGEIAGTDMHIAYDEVTEHLDHLPAKDDRIVLYCRSGPMSEEAAQALAELDYTDVWELDGGMVAWMAGGHELVE